MKREKKERRRELERVRESEVKQAEERYTHIREKFS